MNDNPHPPPLPIPLRCYQGKVDLAEARYMGALSVLEDSVGDDHPMVANVLIDLVETNMKQSATAWRWHSEVRSFVVRSLSSLPHVAWDEMERVFLGDATRCVLRLGGV